MNARLPNAVRMSDERMSYPTQVHPSTDPAHLAALGRVLGLATANMAGARVLDIGCGAATNLLAMAARLPETRFVGLDISGPDIARGQALAQEAGLTNVRLEVADLLHWSPGEEKYDFIIAHGVFSWVPDEVRDRLMRCVRECLAPTGLACISYATYPGCKDSELLRDLLLMRTQRASAPDDRVRVAHATLTVLDRAWERAPGQTHSGGLRAAAARTLAKDPNFLLQDDLGVERDPCYLTQFVDWAAEHGLRYLGDSDFGSMLPDNLPPATAADLAAMQLSPLDTEQMMDYITNRSSRSTLLVGPDARVEPGPNAAVLRDLCLATRLRPKDRHSAGAREALFTALDGTVVTLRGTAVVAMVDVLCRHEGAALPWPRLLAEAGALLRRPLTRVEEATACGDLLALYGKRHIALSSAAFVPDRRPALMPRLTRFNAALAARFGLLVTAQHQTLRLNPAEQVVARALDGTHTLKQIAAMPGTMGLARPLSDFVESLARLGCLTGAEATVDAG